MFSFRSTIESLEMKLVQWNEYETLKDQCMSWIRQTDTKLHAVDLKPTLPGKVEQLEALKVRKSCVYCCCLECY